MIMLKHVWRGCRWFWQFNEDEDKWCLKELQGERGGGRGGGGGDILDTLSSFDGVAQTWFHFQIKRRSASFPHFKIFHLSQVNWRFTISSFWTVVSFFFKSALTDQHWIFGGFARPANCENWVCYGKPCFSLSLCRHNGVSMRINITTNDNKSHCITKVGHSLLVVTQILN